MENKDLQALFSVRQGQLQNSFLRLFYVRDWQKIKVYLRYFLSTRGEVDLLLVWLGLASPVLWNGKPQNINRNCRLRYTDIRRCIDKRRRHDASNKWNKCSFVFLFIAVDNYRTYSIQQTPRVTIRHCLCWIEKNKTKFVNGWKLKPMPART